MNPLVVDIRKEMYLISKVSTYLPDESQSTTKDPLELEASYSGSGAGNPLLVQRSIARQVFVFVFVFVFLYQYLV